MANPEHRPTGEHDSLLPDPAIIAGIARKNPFYIGGYHRTEPGQDLLKGKFHALTTIINFRLAHPELPHNEVLLKINTLDRAVTEKLISLSQITPFPKLETEIFGEDSSTLPD